MTFRPPVAAVVVTYHPDPDIITRLRAILAQTDRLYIIDNGSDAPTIQLLQSFAETTSYCVITLNHGNVGLAAAQNQGIRQALADGAQWVLLLDDDSLPEAHMVQRMLAAWQGRNDPHIGIIAPRIVDIHDKAPARYIVAHGLRFTRHALQPDETRGDITMVIASGSLIHRDVFKRIGLMAEGWFIDAVDFEFCLRACHHGMGLLVMGDAVLTHAVGEKSGIAIVTSNHSAFRRYMIFRNRLFLLRLHGRRFPFLWGYVVTSCSWDFLRMAFLEKDTRAKLKAALRGLWHGITQPVPSAPMLE